MKNYSYLDFWTGASAATDTLMNYTNAHWKPFLRAWTYFNRVESRHFWSRSPLENMLAYTQLWTMNMNLLNRALKGNAKVLNKFMEKELNSYLPAIASGDPQAFWNLSRRIHHLVDQVAYTYPQAIENIKSEFGFHFENQPPTSKVDETDRFFLYQVLPTDSAAKVRPDGKPVLIIPPAVLGANILAFLPGSKRSYAHAFANLGIPTYIRIYKDIAEHEAVQTMTPEDATRDTRRFAEAIRIRHGSMVTLNGYCQGGFMALCDLLSGELDGLVDAFISCVSPIDGTRSKGLARFLEELPETFNDLAYGTKILANGNKVADGTLMGWIYKMKSIESEVPLAAMWRDMMMADKSGGDPQAISKTAAALNHWLIHDRTDLPLEITRTSFASYNHPISGEGTLPVKLFGRELNLRRLKEKKIPWLICYGKADDLVEPASALAPLDFIPVEVTAFPKGHVAIATSWSHPGSDYALNLTYKDGSRGPVRFQLDLQALLDKQRRKQAGILSLKRAYERARRNSDRVEDADALAPSAGMDLSN